MLKINQNGVKPGPRKLAQFKQALTITNTPKLYTQEGKGDAATVYVKFFDPCGNWTWYVTEWDGDDQCFGLVDGHEKELGYISLSELATLTGRMGIGIEIDVHFSPTPLKEFQK